MFEQCTDLHSISILFGFTAIIKHHDQLYHSVFPARLIQMHKNAAFTHTRAHTLHRAPSTSETKPTPMRHSSVYTMKT